MAKWIERDVKCPFYISSTNMQITCEGLDNGTAIRLKFESEEGRKLYMKSCCNSVKNYKNCKITQMLMDKY